MLSMSQSLKWKWKRERLLRPILAIVPSFSENWFVLKGIVWLAQRAAFGDHSIACQQGGSHAAPLRHAGTCPRHFPGHGTGQLAVQADNGDRSLRSRRQYRCVCSILFIAAIGTFLPAVRTR